jgi:hypothetical protein
MRDVTMKKISIIFVGLIILLFSVVYAEEASAPSKVLDHEEDYIVKEGDTLWDISKRFYNDPFLWPRLWQQNQYITNPHHINPGDRIRLYPYRVLIKTEEAPPPTVEEKKPLLPPAEEKVPPPLPPPPELIRLVIYPEVRSAGFITEDLEGIGRIVAAQESKEELTEEDEVYINFQKGISVQKGDQFTIFKVGELVEHPHTGKKIGRKVHILGRATIIATNEGKAHTALITRSFDTIKRGDEVIPFFPPKEELAVKKSERPIYGWAIASKLAKLELADGDIVYIDRGEEDQVQPGTLFDIFRRGVKVENPDGFRKVKLPDEPIARLVVISTQQKTATTVIVHSRVSVHVGDEIMAVVE